MSIVFESEKFIEDYVCKKLESGFISKSVGGGYKINNHKLPASLGLIERTNDLIEKEMNGLIRDEDINE